MKKTEKINRSRYVLKEILSEEWDTSVIADYSDAEIEKMYFSNENESCDACFGYGFNCNIFLNHKTITNYRLLVLYYNFKDLDKASQKVNNKVGDKIKSLYERGYLNQCDSIFIVVDGVFTDSIEGYISDLNIELHNELLEQGLTEDIIDEMDKNKLKIEEDYCLKHFKNVHILNIDSITNNLLKHSLIPEHKVIRDKKSIDEILTKCNANINQLPIILKTDIVSKLKRMSPGDICEITRKSMKCGEYPFYRVCK